MTLTIGITAIIVGIIAYGMGKLSVYIRQDNEHHPGLPGDLSLAWMPRQFELWTRARENEVTAERELAKLVATLSLASIAGVATLGQLKIIGNTGVILLIMGFFLPVIFCIGNLHTRQSLFNEQARRLQEAFEKSLPVRHHPLDAIKHRMVAALPKVGAIFFAIALLLVSLALPARGANCAAARAKYSFDQLYCSGLIQTLARTD